MESQDGPDADGDEGLSTTGIILIVIFVDLLILAALGAYFFKQRQHQANDKRFDDATSSNLIARQTPNAPTIENILAMGSLPDSLDSSLNSEPSHSCSLSGDGLYTVDDKKDLVNVAIL